MKDIFALVYIENDEFNILEMGDKDFILQKYNERINQRKEFKETYKDSYDEKYDFYNAPENENEWNDYFNHNGLVENNKEDLINYLTKNKKFRIIK